LVADGVERPPVGGRAGEGRDLADTSVEMGARDVTGVVLTFTDRPTRIEGTVRTGATPDGDTIVIAYPTDSKRGRRLGATPRRMRASRTASDGSYALPNLPAGGYYVVAVRRPRGLAGPVRPAIARAGGEQVRLVDGEQKSINLRTVNTR
jgi:hypothetical protein